MCGRLRLQQAERYSRSSGYAGGREPSGACVHARAAAVNRAIPSSRRGWRQQIEQYIRLCQLYGPFAGVGSELSKIQVRVQTESTIQIMHARIRERLRRAERCIRPCASGSGPVGTLFHTYAAAAS